MKQSCCAYVAGDSGSNQPAEIAAVAMVTPGLIAALCSFLHNILSLAPVETVESIKESNIVPVLLRLVTFM